MLPRFKLVSLLFLLVCIFLLTWNTSLWAVEAATMKQEVRPAAINNLVPLTGVKQIAAGSDHTCALMTTGGVNYNPVSKTQSVFVYKGLNLASAAALTLALGTSPSGTVDYQIERPSGSSDGTLSNQLQKNVFLPLVAR